MIPGNSHHRTSKIAKLLAFTLLSTSGIVIAKQLVSFDEVMEITRSLGGFDFEIHPSLEKQETNESTSIMNTAKIMFHTQMAVEPQSRDAHAKGHACVAAEFNLSGQIPTELKRGIFNSKSKKIEAIVRFSNGSGTTKEDQIPDGRGMAIKLLNLDTEEENILGTGKTQDFMMVNGPRFFVGSVKDYARMQAIGAKYKGIKRFFLEKAIQESIIIANLEVAIDVENLSLENLEKVVDSLENVPLNQTDVLTSLEILVPGQSAKIFPSLMKELSLMKQGQAPLEFKNAMEITAKKVNSMATESYFSMTSYLLKSPESRKFDQAVKYSVRPVNCLNGMPLGQDNNSNKQLSASYLREDLIQRLNSEPLCFDFYLQPLPAKAESSAKLTTLVEDPRLDFATEPIRIAKVVIPKQDLTKANTQFCENLSFNPWQALPSHQPLGGLNRARKVAVTASSIRRHLFNGAARKEPLSSAELYDLK